MSRTCLLMHASSPQPRGLMKELFSTGQEAYMAQNKEKATEAFQQVIGLAQNGNLDDEQLKMLATSYLRLGYLQLISGHYARSFDLMHQALEVAQKIGFKSCASMAQGNIGVIYSFYGDSYNSLRSLKSALRFAIECDSGRIANNNFQNIIVETLTDAPDDSTMREVLPWFHKINPDSPFYDSSEAAYNMADAYLKGNYKEAIKHAKVWDSLIDPDRGDTPCILGFLYEKNGQPIEAVAALKRGWKGRFTDPKPIHIDDAKALIRIYESMNQPDSAMAWYRRYIELSDSMFKEQKYGVLRDMLSEREHQKAQEQITNERLMRERLSQWLWISVVFVIIVSGAAGLLVRMNHKLYLRNKALYEKETERLSRTQNKLVKSKGKNVERVDQSTNADNDLMERINQVLSQDEVISNPDFSVTILANLCGCGVHNVSSAIHGTTEENFSTLLANARVNLASQRLRDHAYSHLTIEALAQSVGFRSRSNFAAQFRRVTGLNPKEYRKLASEK